MVFLSMLSLYRQRRPFSNTAKKALGIVASAAGPIIKKEMQKAAVKTLKRKMSGVFRSKKKTRVSKRGRKGSRTSFKKRVLSVVNSDKPHGIYEPTRFGTLPVFADRQILNGGEKHVAAYNNDHVTKFSTIFEYFTAPKIKDAAAILFNGKTGTENSFTVTTGNFNELDTRIKSQWVRWTLFNNSNHPKHLVIHTNICKDDTSEDPLDFLNNHITSSMVPNIVGGAYNIHMKNFKPNEIPGFSKYWKHSQFRVTIQPGQRKVLSWKRSAFEYDEEAHMDGASPFTYIKNHSQVMWVEHETPLVFTYEAAPANNFGYQINKATGADRAMCLSLEVTEHYTVVCPPTASEANQIYKINKQVWGVNNAMLTQPLFINTGLDNDAQTPL